MPIADSLWSADPISLLGDVVVGSESRWMPVDGPSVVVVACTSRISSQQPRAECTFDERQGSVTGGLPFDGGGSARLAGAKRHLIRNHERRIEADPETPDKFGRVRSRLLLAQKLLEFRCARFRDRADVRDHFV